MAETIGGTYRLVSPYSPAGDQPKAIEALCEGVLSGNPYQTLLGVTGSGKTFTISNVITQLKRLGISATFFDVGRVFYHLLLLKPVS